MNVKLGADLGFSQEGRGIFEKLRRPFFKVEIDLQSSPKRLFFLPPPKLKIFIIKITDHFI